MSQQIRRVDRYRPSTWLMSAYFLRPICGKSLQESSTSSDCNAIVVQLPPRQLVILTPSSRSCAEWFRSGSRLVRRRSRSDCSGNVEATAVEKLLSSCSTGSSANTIINIDALKRKIAATVSCHARSKSTRRWTTRDALADSELRRRTCRRSVHTVAQSSALRSREFRKL